MNDFAALARLIQAIEPWRAHLVIVGGWAHRLYRFHPMANVPTYQPLLTRDTDLAFANQAPLEAGYQISARPRRIHRGALRYASASSNSLHAGR